MGTLIATETHSFDTTRVRLEYHRATHVATGEPVREEVHVYVDAPEGTEPRVIPAPRMLRLVDAFIKGSMMKRSGTRVCTNEGGGTWAGRTSGPAYIYRLTPTF